MARDFYPFVEEGDAQTDEPGDQQLLDVAGHPARIAVYDDASAAPRVVVIEPTDVRSYLEEITSTVNRLAREQGGRIPFMVIREIVENFVHAYFRSPTISILDDGNTIRFSDQGPGIREKDLALEYGTSSATEEMKRYIRGVGSGLPYAQQYMADKGGSLQIEDNILGGTVVTISTRPSGEARAVAGVHQGEVSMAAPGAVGAPGAFGAAPQAAGMPQQAAFGAVPQVAGVSQQVTPAAQPQFVPAAQPQAAPSVQPQFASASQPQATPAAQMQVSPMSQPQYAPAAPQVTQPQVAEVAQVQYAPAAQPQYATTQPQAAPATAPQAAPMAPTPQILPAITLDERGEAVMEWLSAHESVGPSELVRAYGRSAASWSRTLSALAAQGLVMKIGQKYQLTAVGRAFA